MKHIVCGIALTVFGLALFLFGVGFVVGALVAPARAQDGRHGVGHAENHDVYKQLRNPVTGAICCNAQTADDPNGDCRPGAVWRGADGRIRARIGGSVVSVPESALVPGSPHPPVGMICEKDGYFYCVAMSGAGG